MERVVWPDGPELAVVECEFDTTVKDESAEPGEETIGLGPVMVDQQQLVVRCKSRRGRGIHEAVELQPAGRRQEGRVERPPVSVAIQLLEIVRHQSLQERPRFFSLQTDQPAVNQSCFEPFWFRCTGMEPLMMMMGSCKQAEQARASLGGDVWAHCGSVRLGLSVSSSI